MKREIKFRAWDKKHGRIKNVAQIDLDGFVSYNSNEYWETDFELQQYTGLKDKNGVEIYEGDYLKVKPRGKREVVGYIEYNSEYGQFVVMSKYEYFNGNNKAHTYTILCHSGSSTQTRPYNMKSFGRQLEVIGNIYENPELIKE